jgi:hypothetical protein
MFMKQVQFPPSDEGTKYRTYSVGPLGGTSFESATYHLLETFIFSLLYQASDNKRNTNYKTPKLK